MNYNNKAMLVGAMLVAGYDKHLGGQVGLEEGAGLLQCLRSTHTKVTAMHTVLHHTRAQHCTCAPEVCPGPMVETCRL